MNRRLTTVALAAAATLSVQAAWADNHESDGPTFNMVHVRTCSFNDGQGFEEFERAIGDWNRWADEQGYDDYMAITMTPNYHGPDAFDVAWLGMGATAEGFGARMDNYMAEGGDIMQGFLDVVSCDSHGMWASSEVKAASQSQPPDNVVIVFRDCKLNEGVTSDEIGEAAGAWGEFITANGYPNGEWMWWPVFGGGGAEYDFKLVQGFPNHQAVGQMLEMYGNGGGWRTYQESLGSIATCDDGRVYDGTVRRRMADAD
jgi:hypothetical protein